MTKITMIHHHQHHHLRGEQWTDEFAASAACCCRFIYIWNGFLNFKCRRRFVIVCRASWVLLLKVFIFIFFYIFKFKNKPNAIFVDSRFFWVCVSGVYQRVRRGRSSSSSPLGIQVVPFCLNIGENTTKWVKCLKPSVFSAVWWWIYKIFYCAKSCANESAVANGESESHVFCCLSLAFDFICRN